MFIPKDVRRFWSKVDKSGECWVWTASLQNKGYGQFQMRGKMMLAHRVSWELENGPIPDNQCVLHRCDNRKCVRTAHHFLGTKADNNADMHSKGRARAGRNVTRIKSETFEAIRDEAKRHSRRDVAIQFGLSKSHIARIIRGQFP